MSPLLPSFTSLTGGGGLAPANSATSSTGPLQIGGLNTGGDKAVIYTIAAVFAVIGAVLVVAILKRRG